MPTSQDLQHVVTGTGGRAAGTAVNRRNRGGAAGWSGLSQQSELDSDEYDSSCSTSSSVDDILSWPCARHVDHGDVVVLRSSGTLQGLRESIVVMV